MKEIEKRKNIFILIIVCMMGIGFLLKDFVFEGYFLVAVFLFLLLSCMIFLWDKKCQELNELRKDIKEGWY